MVVVGLLLALWSADIPEVRFGTPISEKDWAVVEDPERGIYDAVVLEDVTSFNIYSIHFYKRIRILSESGKSAAEIFSPDPNAKDVKGRVVRRDGHEVTFNKRRDFVKVLLYKTRGSKEKTRVLVPPGLSKDAVMEISWRVDAAEGLEYGFLEQFYLIQQPYFVKQMRFEVVKAALGGSNGLLHSSFSSTPLKKPARYTVNKEGARIKVVYEDVPALQSFPFGNPFLDQSTAYTMVYKALSRYPSNVDEFWQTFSKEWMREVYSEKINGSPAYRTWLAEVKKKLPEKPGEALLYAHKAFRKKVKVPYLMTPTERAAVGKVQIHLRKSLATAMDDGYITYGNIGQVFNKVLKDLGIEASLIFSNSFDEMLFFPNHLRPFGLPLTRPFFGVKTAAGWVLVSPLHQEYPPGYIPSGYQGTKALVVNPHKKWKVSFITLPRFKAESHQRVTHYQTTIGEDGSISCSLKRQVSGNFNAIEKSRYLTTGQNEREELLKRRWQNSFVDMDLSKVELKGGNQLDGIVTTKVTAKGHLQVEGTDWFILSPFPGQRWPINAPNYWPKNRSQPIILDHCLVQVDLNLIKVPKGWRLKGRPTWNKTNGIGDVTFIASQQGQEITVKRTIRIKNDMMPAEQEPNLKAFIAWVDEAMSQDLGIEKGEASE